MAWWAWTLMGVAIWVVLMAIFWALCRAVSDGQGPMEESTDGE